MMYFGAIKALQKHTRRCRSRMGQVVGEGETRIRPTRIAARGERELLCVTAMQELSFLLNVPLCCI